MLEYVGHLSRCGIPRRNLFALGKVDLIGKQQLWTNKDCVNIRPIFTMCAPELRQLLLRSDCPNTRALNRLPGPMRH